MEAAGSEEEVDPRSAGVAVAGPIYDPWTSTFIEDSVPV
jgi:hypothetical protein